VCMCACVQFNQVIALLKAACGRNKCVCRNMCAYKQVKAYAQVRLRGLQLFNASLEIASVSCWIVATIGVMTLSIPS